MSELSHLLETRFQTEQRPFLHYHRWHTASELDKDAGQVFLTLSAMGVRKGDRVMIAEYNSYAFIVVYTSLLRYGAAVVPVNPKMPAPELAKVMQRSEAVGAFVNPELLPRYEEATDSKLRFVIEVTDSEENGFQCRIAHQHEGTTNNTQTAGVQFPAPDDDTPAILLFTSGTTGTPKGVMLTHSQVMATVRQVISAHKLTADDVSYCFLPLFHINAQVIAVLSTLSSNGRLIVEEKFSASRFWGTVNTHGVTWVSAVPTVIGILIKGTETVTVPKSLRFVRSASAPLPALHAKRFEAMFGVPIIESFGMTEAASQVCSNPLPPAKRKLGSVGKPLGVNLQIVDENDSPLPAGEIGEIAICGPSVVTSYAYGEDTKSFRGGWFHTGDLGYSDDEGYVYITGRSKEMINRAGQKISPREVEEVIGRHDAVHAVAVIGLPDELYGERVVAYVIKEQDAARNIPDDVLKDAFRKLCLSTISAYKCPVEYYFVEEIPVGPTGKIQRSRLRQQVLAVGEAN